MTSLPCRAIAILFLLFSYKNACSGSLSTERSPVAEVAVLVEKLVMADSAQSNEILSKINSIRKRYPENTDILLMYTNSLIGEKHYKEGIEFLNTLCKKKPNRTCLLTRCMLTQRLGDKEIGCYQEVVRLSEQQHLMDSDYVTALFFTDTKKFSTVKQQLINKNQFNESDFLVFNSDEEKILHEFFP